MNQFYVRIQLNSVNGPSPSGQTYADLHEAMSSLGASRQIAGQTGVMFDLPNAEYLLPSNYSAVQVRDMVVRTAERSWRDAEVLVLDWVTVAFKLKRAA